MFFTYDPTIGEFLLTFENLKIPKKGYHYSCNEAHVNRWDDRVKGLFELYQES